MGRFNSLLGISAVASALVIAGPAVPQQGNDSDWRANYNLYGTPGLIDLPSALSAPNAELATTVSIFGDFNRTSFTFQVLPRLSGSFRYAELDTFDRSFDIQYRLADEGRYRPAIAIGLRDFLGTGRFSSEYVVATKTVTPNLRVTGGLGWGRLGTVGGFTNPLGVVADRFETRPDESIDTGGTVLAGQFFRGDAAFFGGVEWRLHEDWTLLAEYSSDAYEREISLVGFERESPLNFGVTWKPNDSYQFSGYYLYGSEIGVSATILIDPLTRAGVAGLDSAPFPVLPRANAVAAATWDVPEVERTTVDALGQIMAADGFTLVGAEVTGSTLRVRYQNGKYRSEAQGVGRVARILTAVAPLNVDTFVLEPSQNGIALSAVTLRRADLEVLENQPNAAALSYDRAVFGDAAGPAPEVGFEDPSPAFRWGISPYVEITLFDGDEPVRGDVGLEASFSYELQPNLVLAGAYRERIAGNRDEIGSISASTLPDVRRNSQRYGAENGRGIENLYLTHYGRPGSNLYSRVTGGYLERSYAGVSGEVLWKPVGSQLALGAEVNYSVLRDFDLGFGFRPLCLDADCNTFADDDYDIVTGHVSAYYDFDNGFVAQVDMGRYLAGDWGATFTMDREFENGWKVGGYFTLTNVDFDDFGEGSFDKGVRIEIPVDALIGQPTREASSTTLTSLTRDGGARLDVEGRLYDVIDDGHQGKLADSWGRFWR